ncbi:MAG: LamG-like jellyroll fold domain-containing protein [Pseudomonadota bacterium]
MIATRALSARRHAALSATLLLVLQVGCPAAVLDQDQLAFECQHDFDCSPGYRCMDNRCRPVSTSLDGGRLRTDAGASDATLLDTVGIEAGHHDLLELDRSAADSTQGDRSTPDGRVDDGTGLDGAGVDRVLDAGGDASTAADAAAGDGGVQDVSLPTDAAAADQSDQDATTSDLQPLDAALGDQTQPDSAPPVDAALADNAPAVDAAQPDTAPDVDAAVPDSVVAVDAAQPDTAPGVDAALPDSAVAVDAAPPPCPGSQPAGPFCDGTDPLLVACYTFDSDVDNGNGSWTVMDSSGEGNHGQGSGYSYVTGHQGQAASFAASGQVEVADSASLDIAGSFTLEAWVWLQDAPGVDRVTILDNNGQYGLFVYPGTPPFLRCSAGATLLDGPVPALRSWVHVACVDDQDAAERRLLIDGNVVQVGAASAPGTTDTTHMALGANSPGNDNNWNGRLDQIRIWNGVRSDAELCWAAQP